MTSRDFCYWLQGYFEIGGVTDDTLSPEQVNAIRKHLALVFVHEIDPSAGPPAKQDALNAIHGTAAPTIGGIGPHGQVYRC